MRRHQSGAGRQVGAAAAAVFRWPAAARVAAAAVESHVEWCAPSGRSRASPAGRPPASSRRPPLFALCSAGRRPPDWRARRRRPSTEKSAGAERCLSCATGPALNYANRHLRAREKNTHARNRCRAKSKGAPPPPLGDLWRRRLSKLITRLPGGREKQTNVLARRRKVETSFPAKLKADLLRKEAALSFCEAAKFASAQQFAAKGKRSPAKSQQRKLVARLRRANFEGAAAAARSGTSSCLSIILLFRRRSSFA